MRDRFLSGRWSESVGVVLAGAVVVGLAVGAVGCGRDAAASRGPIAVHDPRDVGGLEASERLVGARSNGAGGVRHAFAASVDGQAIDANELGEMLSEAAGEEVLAEAALDQVLRTRCKAAGIEITRNDVEAEEVRLREAVSRAALAGETGAEQPMPAGGAESGATERLIDRVRTRRGLGPIRFARLLERTAMLRRLSAGEVASVDEAELRRRYEVTYGARVRCRVMRGASATEVGAWVARARRGGDSEVAFAREALEHSTDPSAGVGGLVPAFSTSDPAYPAALREAIDALDVGGITGVVSVDGGYAAAMLVERVPATGELFDRVRDSLVKELEQERERRAMEAYARRALAEAQVRAASAGLQWSWRRRVEREVVP